MEATRQLSQQTRSVEDISGTHFIGDDIWGGINSSDVSIDTANNKEVMVGNHITEQHTFEFCRSVQPELLTMTSYKPHTDDLPLTYKLDFLDNLEDLNILLKANNVTNNVVNTSAIDHLNQEQQDYYNQWDQQSIP